MGGGGVEVNGRVAPGGSLQTFVTGGLTSQEEDDLSVAEASVALLPLLFA